MGLTSALYTGLSGLSVNQLRIDTIGNNIANVNTTAFKASRALFQTQFSRNLSLGNGPSNNSGGVNPIQIGLGAALGTIQKNFSSGSIETTGINSDLAIDGSGMFIIRRGLNQQAYTRDGSFALNSNNVLVTTDGNVVQGFGVDENFNIIPGVLQDLSVPVGTQSLARATEGAALDGDLSAIGSIATQSSTHVSQALLTGGGQPVTGGTALTDVRSADNPGVQLFQAGTVITVSRVAKGERELPAQTFVVGTDGSTLADYANWLNGVLGINTSGGLAGNPGVVVENGGLTIRGNAGQQNDFEITANDFRSDSAAAPLPFTFTKTADANGSGAYTGFSVYDSLGTPVQVNITFALEATPDSGPVWRYYAESADASGTNRALTTGTISFDTQGNFLSASNTQIPINRSGTGATSPLSFDLDFSSIHGLSTLTSNVIMAEQDGFPPGTLTNYAVGTDGAIIGIFSNGVNRTLGQVALASFENPPGLIAESDNIFLAGPNSGEPSITEPGLFGAGRILGGALELSNVDLSREFIGLITSSTGFQAASRVITVSNDLLNQLLLITR